jgi:hypothetical protein
VTRENIPAAIHGCGALASALDCIGHEHRTAHDMAKIICDHEMELRALLAFALDSLASEQ